MKRLISFVLGAAAFGCSDSTTPALSVDASTVDVLNTPTDPSCQESSFAQTRSDPPTTTCLANATCMFSVNNGAAGCDGGATSYPVGPVHWDCTCETDERWNCNVDPSSQDAGTNLCP